ncbi:Sec23-binding domain of Sec16-domain-containing protein [Mycotypha africana]|uniref:Sec23-binding domain of Sec16-domain-containing protein n=1 Tax=Mycotypha africana TaxID=64632 RepID=UPI00230123B1|nr:Sec23-binding domain of Sec16-domain-containing protein [Mycotypha africana]KAI8973399.1 Sec23-binding domain of Sec16-domain-containing protein [Mycotypha africana]
MDQQYQQQQYDPSQWIQFDPNVHYFYDEQGQVQYYDPNTNQVYDMSQYGYDQQTAYQYDPQYSEYYAQQQQTPVTNAYTNNQQQYDPNVYAMTEQQQQQQQYGANANAYSSNEQQPHYDSKAYQPNEQQPTYDSSAYAGQQQQREQQREQQTSYQNYEPNAYIGGQQIQEQGHDSQASATAPGDKQDGEVSFENAIKEAQQTGFEFGANEQQQQLYSQFSNDNGDGEQEVPLYVPSTNNYMNDYNTGFTEEEQPVSLTAVPALPPPAQQLQSLQEESLTLSAVPVPPPASNLIQAQQQQETQQETILTDVQTSSAQPPLIPSQQPKDLQHKQFKQPENPPVTSPTASSYGYTPLERSSTVNSSKTYSEMDQRRFSSPFSVAGGASSGPAGTGSYLYPMERSATVPPPMMDRMSSPRPQLVPCPDPNCDGENKPKAKFCCECGRPLAGISRSTTPSVAVTAGALGAGISSSNVFGMEPINPISLGQIAEQVRRSALDDKKDMLKESLENFSKHSVIVHSTDLDDEEKRKKALAFMKDRMDKFEDKTKVLLWSIVKLMLEYSDCSLGDGGALDKAIIAEILPQVDLEQETLVEVPKNTVASERPLDIINKNENDEGTKALTAIGETAVVLKDEPEIKDAIASENIEKKDEKKDEKADYENEPTVDDDAAKQTDSFEEVNIASKDVAEMEANNYTSHEASMNSAVKRNDIDDLEKLLLQGDRAGACSYASKKNLWAHAFSIASGDSGLLKSTVTRFIHQELYANSTESVLYSTFEHKQLRMLYSVFAGNGTDAVADFVKQKEGDTPDYSAENLKGWKRALVLILANRSDNDQAVIANLGDKLQQIGSCDNDARLCYFLSPDVAALHSDKIVGDNLYTDLDALYLAELYEFASKANVQQDFKLALAWWLSEFGMKDESQKYCNSIVNYLSTSADTSSMLERLKQLGDITHVTIDGESATAFLNKETFDALIDSIESNYNNSQKNDNTYLPGYGYEAQATDYGQPYGYSEQAVDQQDSALQQNTYNYGYSYADGYTISNDNGDIPAEAATGPSSAAAGAVAPAVKAIKSPFQNTTEAKPIKSPLQQANVNPVSSPFGMQQNAVRSPFGQQQPSASPFQSYQPDVPADQGQQNNSSGGWWNSDAGQENIEDLQAGNNTTAATTSMYEPSSTTMYQPNAYTPSATATNPQQSAGGTNAFDEDDDDLGFGNSSTKKAAKFAADSTADNSNDNDTNKKENDEKAADSKKENERKEKSGWGLFSLFGSGKKDKESSDEKKPVKANLGEQSTFYYDEKEKRWVNKLNDSKPASAPLPPPPKASTPQPTVASPMAPPPSAAKPNSMPPSRSQSALSGPPGFAGGSSGAVPPPSISTPPSGRRAGGSRKPMRSRYVDVLNNST